MCLDVKMGIRDWPHFIPVVQSNLNHTPVPSLGNKAPVELFCVLPAASPLDVEFNTQDNAFLEISKTSSQIEKKLASLQARVQEVHKVVQEARADQTRRNQEAQRTARKANFDVVDYVLRSRVDQKHNDKLLVTWIGPYQVIGTDEHSFRVQHLVTGAEADVHASRLKFYADASFEVTEETREHMATQGIVLTVAELKEHRWNSAKKCHEILVGWKGLEPIEDSWESLSSLYKDIPVMVKQYIATASDAEQTVILEQL